MQEEEQLLNPNQIQEIDETTLETAVTELKVWRSNKKRPNEKIPAHVWDKIFISLEVIPEARVLSACGIDKLQVERERKTRQKTNHPTKSNYSNPKAFINSYQKPFTSLPHSNESLNMQNLVVEFYRKDGALMKIYACNTQLPALLNTFFQAQ
jgi:hypothetical protein